MKTLPGIICLGLALGLPVAPAFSAEPWTPGAGWTLAWSDEFNGTVVDPANWTYDLGTGNGWGNSELENYTTSNAFIEHGALIIEARKNPDNSYTSARLKTQGLQSWTYGKIAARIRLPYGKGIWPAFWMLGNNISTPGSNWPKCGEIDIMEMIGGGENFDDTHYATVHYDANNAYTNAGSGPHELPDPQFFHEDYHVFELEWNSSLMIWKLDSVEFYRLSIDPILQPTREEFHRPFFILLNLAVGGTWPGYPNATTVFPQRMAVDWVRVYREDDPRVTISPASQTPAVGSSATFTAAAAGTAPFTYQWRKAGSDIAGATAATLTLANLTAADTSSYDVVVTNSAGSTASNPALLGLATTSKVIGSGEEIGWDIHHQNGNTFDQVLLTGAAEVIRADYDPDPAKNQITRTSFVDLDEDIVQVEFSGPGTLSLVLDSPTGPATPVNYNQATNYMKGHAGIVITGATEQTNVSVFSVGKATAVNQALFKDGVAYDGIADIAFIAIASANGKFGGVRTANANYFATKGLTGVYAPGVDFQGPVFIGDITAFNAATPVIRLGSVTDARITGGDLAQANDAAVEVSGITQLKFTAGGDSHGKELPAQTNQAVLKESGVDVTAQIVAGP